MEEKTPMMDELVQVMRQRKFTLKDVVAIGLMLDFREDLAEVTLDYLQANPSATMSDLLLYTLDLTEDENL